jgi:serine/threonine protein kinase
MPTQILNQGTQDLGGSTTGSGATFTGGLLRIGDAVSGWTVESRINTLSGEADLYIAMKNNNKGVIKYYRDRIKPKTDILEKLKGLNHPDIVNLFEFGFHNEHFYEIMEYAEGGSLDSRNSDGTYRYLPFTEEQTIQVCKEILNSFKIFHEKGIIHRDIKPANLYYRKCTKTPNGKYAGEDIVIGDFGISSIKDETAALHRTQTASRTTGYAAPEVLSGIISSKMDYYALGITLWELLTGQDPFALENGKRRNDAHLIRDTIEGRIADDLLSRKLKNIILSKSMQHLIRGLLVIDPEQRWGYNEVTRHLNGEIVPVYEKPKKSLNFTIGNKTCTSLEELGEAIMDNPDAAKRYIFSKNILGLYLETDYPSEAKLITAITEESSAQNDYDNGLLKIAHLLNPRLPLKASNGFIFSSIDDIIFLLENAPETMLPLLKDRKSKLYTFLEIQGCNKEKEEIRKLEAPGDENGGESFPYCSDVYYISKAEVILRNYTIKPFKLERYKDFILTGLEQINGLPGDLRDHILNLVKERSCECLFLPWLDLLIPDISVDKMKTGSWEEFIAGNCTQGFNTLTAP